MITVKILDVESEDYDKIVVQEFINLDEELQLMVQITINKALDIENDPVITNNLIYYNQPPQSPTTYIKTMGQEWCCNCWRRDGTVHGSRESRSTECNQ